MSAALGSKRGVGDGDRVNATGRGAKRILVNEAKEIVATEEVPNVGFEEAICSRESEKAKNTRGKRGWQARLDHCQAKIELLIATLRAREEQISRLCALHDEAVVELERLRSGSQRQDSDRISPTVAPIISLSNQEELVQRQVRLQKIATTIFRRPWWWSFILPEFRNKMLWKLLRQQGLFDAQRYLALNPDVAVAGIDPVLHYIRYGVAEARPAPVE